MKNQIFNCLSIFILLNVTSNLAFCQNTMRDYQFVKLHTPKDGWTETIEIKSNFVINVTQSEIYKYTLNKKITFKIVMELEDSDAVLVMSFMVLDPHGAEYVFSLSDQHDFVSLFRVSDKLTCQYSN